MLHDIEYWMNSYNEAQQELAMYREWLIPLIQIADGFAEEGMSMIGYPIPTDVLTDIAVDLGMDVNEGLGGADIIDHLTRNV